MPPTPVILRKWAIWGARARATFKQPKDLLSCGDIRMEKRLGHLGNRLNGVFDAIVPQGGGETRIALTPERFKITTYEARGQDAYYDRIAKPRREAQRAT